MWRFVRHFEPGRDRACGVARKFGSAGLRQNFVSGGDDFLGKFVSQEDGRFRDPKIRRPPFGRLHTMNEGLVFFGGKIGIETLTEIRVHGQEDGTERQSTKASTMVKLCG